MSEADAEWADAILFGSPTRFGAVSSELKAYIDGLGELWFQGKLNGKVGSAFTSTSSVHDGNESTIISLYNLMAHLGLIIVPLGYADPVLFKAGTPYGASAVSGQDRAPPTADDLECFEAGRERPSHSSLLFWRASSPVCAQTQTGSALEVARFQGRCVARVASALKAAQITSTRS